MTAEKKLQFATDQLVQALQEASNKTVSKVSDNAMDRKCTKKQIKTLHENLDIVIERLAKLDEVEEQLAEVKEQVAISKTEQALLFAFEKKCKFWFVPI